MCSEDNGARRQAAQRMLQGFFVLARHWQLSRSEAMTLLGLTATSTYANWKNGKTGPIPRDTLERISYLFSIDDRLNQHLPSEPERLAWLRREHPHLNGHSPMTRMLEGRVVDIFWLQEHLDHLLRNSLPDFPLPPKSLSPQSPLTTIHSL